MIPACDLAACSNMVEEDDGDQCTADELYELLGVLAGDTSIRQASEHVGLVALLLHVVLPKKRESTGQRERAAHEVHVGVLSIHDGLQQ